MKAWARCRHSSSESEGVVGGEGAMAVGAKMGESGASFGNSHC